MADNRKWKTRRRNKNTRILEGEKRNQPKTPETLDQQSKE
jgi:hypothetical protein